MAKAGISIADIAAGVTAYHSILAALLHRAKTGAGDHIEVSMLEAMAEWMGFPMYFAFDGAPPPPRNGAGHATIYPYGPYDTADGSVFFGLQNDREWAAFAESVLAASRPCRRPALQGQCRPRQPSRRAGAHHHRRALARSPPKKPSPASKAPASRTARVSDMAALWEHPQLEGARSLGRIRLAGRAAARVEAGQRRRLGAALRSGAGARRTHAMRSSPNSALPTRRESKDRDMIPKPDRHQEMREALRALCAEFPPEYHRSA